MTRIEKIIVVVLGLLCLSSLGYIIGSWTSQGTPAAVRRRLLPPPRSIQPRPIASSRSPSSGEAVNG